MARKALSFLKIYDIFWKNFKKIHWNYKLVVQLADTCHF